MLHELVHNVQGPHNAVFYKLLDEITEVLTASVLFDRTPAVDCAYLVRHSDHVHCPVIAGYLP